MPEKKKPDEIHDPIMARNPDRLGIQISWNKKNLMEPKTQLEQFRHDEYDK